MNYQGTQTLAHPPERVWQALLDPQVLSACIAGCERFERVSDNGYTSTVKIAIGPVAARFDSSITLVDVAAPERCTLQFAGQGGVAGFGKGEARVVLRAEAGGGTRLDWNADAHVGGRLAQIGSRLIEATVRKMSEDFFRRFAAQLNDAPAASAGSAEAPAATPAAAAPSARPPVKAWARAVAVALGGGMVYWLCFKG